MPRGNKVVILAAIGMLLLTLCGLFILDQGVNALFRNHEPQQVQPINIDVSGDGSSGTGNVQNIQVVQSGKTGTVTASPKATVVAPEKTNPETVYPSAPIDARGTSD